MNNYLTMFQSNMRSYAIKLPLTILLLMHISTSFADENTKHQLKLNTISKLLNSSSVSKYILNSGNDVAIQYYNLAKTAKKSAVFEFKKGNINKSNILIKKATDALSDATLFANMNKKNVHIDAERLLYEETKESVEALLLAVHRVAKEKGTEKQNKPLIDKIDKLNDQAHDHASEHSYNKALQKLEQTLALIRGNIIELKMGDTLVRTLSFANPQEEYAYEIDRNDAHFMLLKMFLAEKTNNTKNKDIYSKRKQSAQQLRKKAEAYANKNDHKKAISTLEKSTLILIKAIRLAGAKIPS